MRRFITRGLAALGIVIAGTSIMATNASAAGSSPVVSFDYDTGQGYADGAYVRGLFLQFSNKQWNQYAPAATAYRVDWSQASYDVSCTGTASASRLRLTDYAWWDVQTTPVLKSGGGVSKFIFGGYASGPRLEPAPAVPVVGDPCPSGSGTVTDVSVAYDKQAGRSLGVTVAGTQQAITSQFWYVK